MNDTKFSGNKLEIQKLIDQHKLDTFEKVKEFFSKEPYHFKVTLDHDKNVYVMKYDQVNTDFRRKASHEARGIILCKDTNKVVCYPFNKFFNHGEKHASNIDWSTAVVQHKYDGSIIKLYHHNDEWHVATNGTADAKKAESFGGRTLYDLFMEASKGLDYAKLDKNCTYMFELMHPEQVIVIRYETPKIVHIGTRNNITFEESYDHIGIEQVETFDLKTVDDCIKAAEYLGPSQEGYVVRDANWRRVKIKGPTYVKLHHTLTSSHLSARQCAAQMVLKGEEGEVRAYESDARIKEICDEIDVVKNKLSNTLEYMEKIWSENYDPKIERKELVGRFQKYPNYFSFMMGHLKGTEFRDLIFKKFSKPKISKGDTEDFLKFLGF